MDCWSLFSIAVTVFIAMLGVLLPIAGMFLWNRAEANSDRQAISAKIDSNAKDTRDMIDANIVLINSNMKETRDLIHSNMKETREVVNAIKEEIKDFHGRLCAIEANRKIQIIDKHGQIIQ